MIVRNTKNQHKSLLMVLSSNYLKLSTHLKLDIPGLFTEFPQVNLPVTQHLPRHIEVQRARNRG